MMVIRFSRVLQDGSVEPQGLVFRFYTPCKGVEPENRPWITRRDCNFHSGLRIDKSMRYNQISGKTISHTTSACNAEDITRKLTKPTDLGGGRADFIIAQKRPGGIHRGVLRCRAGLQPKRPINRRSK